MNHSLLNRLATGMQVEVWDEDDVVDCYIGGCSVELGTLDRNGSPSSVTLSLLNRQGKDAGE